jgi:uncharacterized protein (DUF4415 family)
MSDENMKQRSRTNWEKLDQLTDDQIDTSDITPLDASFFERATLRMPPGKVAVTVSIDEDVLDWFKSQGQEYQKQMNAALRIYVEAHKELA